MFLETLLAGGYTHGMKTAISLPDSVFREAEQFAHRSKKSRSQLYTEAVTEYLARHAPDAVTEAMDSVCDRLDSEDDKFTTMAAQKILKRESW